MEIYYRKILAIVIRMAAKFLAPACRPHTFLGYGSASPMHIENSRLT